jgi:hypothetical protein
MAAQCVQNKGQENARAVSGSYFYFKDNYDDDDETAKSDVSEFIIHPDWDPKDSHYRADIAIAVLKEPITLSNEIQPVPLNNPSNPIQSLVGRNGIICGWGLTEDLELYSELREVSVPLVDQALCNSSGQAFRSIMSETTFCAGARDGKTGPCIGKFSDFMVND